jgi:hypothetical protein
MMIRMAFCVSVCVCMYVCLRVCVSVCVFGCEATQPFYAMLGRAVRPITRISGNKCTAGSTSVCEINSEQNMDVNQFAGVSKSLSYDSVTGNVFQRLDSTTNCVYSTSPKRSFSLITFVCQKGAGKGVRPARLETILA